MLKKEEVKKVRDRQRRIHHKILDFFRNNENYYLAEEIAHAIDEPIDEVEKRLMVMAIYVDMGDVKFIDVDGKTYFGKKEKPELF